MRAVMILPLLAACFEVDFDDKAGDDNGGDDGGDDVFVEGDCVQADLGDATGTAVLSSTTVGGDDNFDDHCETDTGPDVSIRWQAPSDGTYQFTTEGSAIDTVLVVYWGECPEGATQIDCNDDTTYGDGLWSESRADLLAGDTLVLVVDAFSNEDRGAFQLNIQQL